MKCVIFFIPLFIGVCSLCAQNNLIFNGSSGDGFAVAGFAPVPDVVNNTIFAGGVSDGFAFASVGSVGNEVPLPVTFTLFSATSTLDAVILNWQTAQEKDNDRFEIERSDGSNFETIGKVKGSGSSFSPQDYEYIDAKPVPGISYYRLRQVDFSGSFLYSNIIAVKQQLRDEQTFCFYPNPLVDGKLTIESNNPADDVTIEIRNSNGKVVFEETCKITDTSLRSLITINTALPSGIYLLLVHGTSAGMLSERIVVLK